MRFAIDIGSTPWHASRWHFAWLGLGALLALVGCGGGDGASVGSGKQSALAIESAPAFDSAEAAPAAESAPPDTIKRALWALCCDPIETHDNWPQQGVMDWAERNFAALFPGPKPTQISPPYSYRAYDNGNFIGLTATDIYLLGTVAGSNTTPLRYQSIADFCLQQAGVCPQVQTVKLTVDGLLREFVLYKPGKAEGQRNLPVVFAVHGSGGSGSHFMQVSGWRAVADREGFMVAFPSALKHCYVQDTAADANSTPDFPAEARVEAKWGALPLGFDGLRPLCTPSQVNQLVASRSITAREAQEVDHALPDDVRFFRAMAELLVRDHAADPKRLYASGFSNGAEMTQTLASRASDLFAALSAASGAVAELTLPAAARPVSMVLTFGADEGPSAPVPVDRDVATLLPVALNMQPFLSVLSLGAVRSFANVTVDGYSTGYYQFSSSRLTPPGGNTLHVGIMAGLGHRFPPELPNTLWAFFSTQRLP